MRVRVRTRVRASVRGRVRARARVRLRVRARGARLKRLELGLERGQVEGRLGRQVEARAGGQVRAGAPALLGRPADDLAVLALLGSAEHVHARDALAWLGLE